MRKDQGLQVLTTCEVCKQQIQVAIFKGERYCCDSHRKILEGE